MQNVRYVAEKFIPVITLLETGHYAISYSVKVSPSFCQNFRSKYSSRTEVSKVTDLLRHFERSQLKFVSSKDSAVAGRWVTSISKPKAALWPKFTHGDTQEDHCSCIRRKLLLSTSPKRDSYLPRRAEGNRQSTKKQVTWERLRKK